MKSHNPEGYSAIEAQVILGRMAQASDVFYGMARLAGCHSFIEFAGLMNEYINVCRDMTAAGDLTWIHANTHSERGVALRSHHIRYLAEKLDCIYGASLRTSPELAAAFGFVPGKEER